MSTSHAASSARSDRLTSGSSGWWAPLSPAYDSVAVMNDPTNVDLPNVPMEISISIPTSSSYLHDSSNASLHLMDGSSSVALDDEQDSGLIVMDTEQATIPQSVGVVAHRHLLDRIQKLEQAIVVADITNHAIVLAAQQRTSLAKSELQAMQDHFFKEKEQRQAEISARQGAQETKLLKTKEAMLALKSENEKLRASLSNLQAKVNEANQINEALYQQGLAIGMQVDLIGDTQVPTLERANQKLGKQILAVKTDNKLLAKQVMIHQDTYMDQAKGRLKYQETMATVLTAMHKAAASVSATTAKKRSSALNRNVQENVVVLALGAESNAKAIMVNCCDTRGADANTHKTCLVAQQMLCTLDPC
jgi:hypothetical protein